MSKPASKEMQKRLEALRLSAERLSPHHFGWMIASLIAHYARLAHDDEIEIARLTSDAAGLDPAEPDYETIAHPHAVFACTRAEALAAARENLSAHRRICAFLLALSRIYDLRRDEDFGERLRDWFSASFGEAIAPSGRK